MASLLLIFLLSVGLTEGFNSQLPPPWVAPTNMGGWGSRSKVPKRSKSPGKRDKDDESTTTSARSSATAVTDTPKDSSPGSDEERSKDSTEDFPNESSTVAAASRFLEMTEAYGSGGETPLRPRGDGVRRASVRGHLPSLFKMCSPIDLLLVVASHVVATRLAVGPEAMRSVLARPSHATTMLASCLTSGASAVVARHYDARRRPNRPFPVPEPAVMRFLVTLSASLLPALVFVPGKVARLNVVVGALFTVYYASHTRPKSWIGNVTRAGVAGLAPLTAAAAAGYSTGVPVSEPLQVAMLSCALFLGTFGRELWKDASSVARDREDDVRTVPVVHGRRFADRAVLGAQALAAVVAAGGPLVDIMTGRRTSASVRRAVLSVAGGGALLHRAVGVVRSQGLDDEVVKKAVKESRAALLVILSSFF